MIARYVLHVEAHRGRLPRLSLRRAPRHGDRVIDGGIPGTLEACEPCSGDGFLVRPGRDLTGVERIRYAAAAGFGVSPRLLGLPPLAPRTQPVAPGQGVRAVPPPAGKNDQAPGGDHRGDDGGRLRLQRDEARAMAAGLQAEVDALRRSPYARSGDPLAEALPPADEAARAHPLHRVITDVLRWGTVEATPAVGHGTPTDHLWATAYGGASTWHGDPDEVAAVVLRAIAAAPVGPLTREAWARLRSEVVTVPERPSGFTVPGGGA